MPNSSLFYLLGNLLFSVLLSEQQQIRYSGGRSVFPASQNLIFELICGEECGPEDTLVVSLLQESNKQVSLMHERRIDPHQLRHRKKYKFNISVPSELVFFDSRKLFYNPTDLFTKKLKIRACVADKTNPSACEITRIYEHHVALVQPPCKRLEPPSYTMGWELWLKRKIYDEQSHICKSIDDIIDILTYPVVSAGNSEAGFVRKLEPLSWPYHLPHKQRQKFARATRFTITSCLFLLEYCKSEMCNVISHRSPEIFLTPTILLNRRGHLHFQMHDETGAGEAFMTPKAVPLRKWVQFTFMADGNKTQLTIDFPGTGIHSYSIHHTFKGIILNDENGIWSVGGYPGLEGFHGILSHLTLYRIQALMPNKISNRRKRHESKVMKAFVRQQQKCLAAKELFHQMLHASASRRWMALKRVCPNMRSHPNIRKITRKLPSNQVNILERVFHVKEFTGLNTISSVAEAIYERGVSSYDKNMTDKLELSGCFGHTTSLYVSSILHLYGILTPVSVVKGVAQQLLAAAYGNTLAQMSLAYKHKFGQAGLQKSPCISAGYYRAAAVAAKKIFEREEHSVNTQSEMIRIDSHDVFRRDRGPSSNLVNWLKRQAGYGSATAQKQLAEILFHGQHGVDANKHEALNLYRYGAAQGDASSMYNLGVLHLKGIEVAKNETLAMLLFEAAAEKNFSMAYGSLGYYELVSRNNLTGAIHYWKKATEFGDRDGMFNLGAQYETGVSGVLEKDKVYALELFQRSAEMGQYAACVKVADSLMIGDVISLTNADAIRYYRFVAENHPGIGSFLRKAFDSYLSSNMKEALLNYLMAAETGLALAFYNAALICQQLDSSAELFNLQNCSLLLHGKAAELDWAPSLIQMGDRYWYGDGVPSSKEKAASNYAEAFNLAESPRALFNLAYIIENSFPVKALKLKEIQNVPIITGNLSLARRLYSRCQHSPTDDNEGYYPCTLALLKLNIKNIYQEFSNYFKTIIGIGRYLS